MFMVYVILLALLALEGIGTVTFTTLYLLHSSWRSSPVGRHLAYYGLTLSGLYVATLMVMLWPVLPVLFIVLVMHAGFAAAVWQRVYLVVREQRAQRALDKEEDMITAKVILNTKQMTGDGGATLQFHADYADGRNKEWAAATPTLNLQMTVSPDKAALFEQGARFTLMFEQDDPTDMRTAEQREEDDAAGREDDEQPEEPAVEQQPEEPQQ
jgi:hypothetical protein